MATPARLTAIKNRILGRSYDLSFSYIADSEMRRLNRRYRRKDTTTDILSFPLSKSAGEILISRQEAVKKSKDFGMSGRTYIPFLFIHGCLHLKGRKHGRIMERLEDRWCREFGIPLPQRNGIIHRSRH